MLRNTPPNGLSFSGVNPSVSEGHVRCNGVGQRVDHAQYVRGREHPTNLPVEVPEGDLVMFGVVRGDAVRGDDHLMVPLIGVDGGHSRACVSVHAGDHQKLGSDLRKARVEVRAEEGTVALLYDHRIRGKPIELRQKVTTRGPGDGD